MIRLEKYDCLRYNISDNSKFIKLILFLSKIYISFDIILHLNYWFTIKKNIYLVFI
jgi:hypothetical protein